MSKWILIMMAAGSLLWASCENQFVKESSFRRSGTDSGQSGGRQNISLVCWNVQTFFDPVTVGTEYKDFKNSERWNKEKYMKRLDRLCDVMVTLNPDIFVMEEIENSEVVQDISNALAGQAWDHRKNWQHVCFAKETGSAIGCAVFSRYELCGLKTHTLDVRTQGEDQPSSRPIMEVTVCTGNQDLKLFVNHWKSKSGGEEETEIWRDWQELALAEAAGNCTVLMCGDFNRSAEDFILSNGGNKTNTLLRGSNGLVHCCSPWFRSDGKFSIETGSYFYNSEWERIDNILISDNLNITYFNTVSEPPLADEDGIPAGYKLYTGEGCSDHLPLKCVISF